MKEAPVKTNPFGLYLIISILGLMGIDLSAQGCLDGYAMRDTVEFTIGLGTCEVSDTDILAELGLSDCGGDVSLSVSGVGLNQSRIVELIDEVNNEIVDNFTVTVSPEENVFPTDIFLEISPFDCDLDKTYILNRLGIDIPESSIISTIHFISGTARVTQFPVGEEIFIDRVICGDGYVFATDLSIFLFPDHILPISTTLNHSVGFSTELVELSDILRNNPLFRYTDVCDIDRLTIDNEGPFGFGQSTIGNVFLDEALIAENLRVNISAPACPSAFLDIPIAMDQCFVTERDILDTLGFSPATTDFDLVDIRLRDGDSFDNESFTIESISVRGIAVCSQPIMVTYMRPTDINLDAESIACNSQLNISLNEDCAIELNSDVLLANTGLCFLNFIVRAEDEQGTLIAEDHNITLTNPGTYVVTVSDPRSTLSCTSTVVVEDKHIFDVVCEPDTIACQFGIDPMMGDQFVAFPFVGVPSSFEPLGNNTFNIINDDDCGIKLGSFQDITTETCSGDFQEIIDRNWLFSDLAGNQDTCIQRIFVLRTQLDSIDEFEDFETDCMSDFTLFDDNGNPAPAEVGVPTIGGGAFDAEVCGILRRTYSDNVFELCGRSRKIIREWLIIDWCTNDLLSLNQTIIIEDGRPPVLLEPLEDITLNTHPFLCGAEDIQLPTPQLEDCGSDVIDVNIFYETTDAFGERVMIDNGSSTMISSISMGSTQAEFDVVYVFTDECQNVSTDTLVITIQDDQPPVAVCDQFTSISIAGNGMAQVRALTFDDLSVDNCGIASYTARKVDGVCSVGEDFSELIFFCCEEVGQTLTVEFKVTDIAGNSNTCHISVEVFDKFTPLIVCPDDITIDCSLDPLDLMVTGEAQAIDNCSVDSLFFTDVSNLDACGKGTIERTWTAIDRGGQVVNCDQIITIVSDEPFEITAEEFPGDTVIIGCFATVDPEFTGMPALSQDGCADVVASYEDTYFTDVNDGCFTIIREWVVIDWCQFSTSVPDQGYWSMGQAITVANESAPEFVNFPSDTTLCITGTDCMGQFVLSVEAVDDCTPVEDFDWFHQIRTTGDDVEILRTSTSPVLNATLESGLYEVIFSVSDGCENINTDTINLTIQDCQAPIINCPTVENAVVLRENGEAVISIDDFEVTVEDNCTSAEDLMLSFSAEGEVSNLIFNCQDIADGRSEQRLVTIYVRDEAGNLGECEAPLEIFDNGNNLCEDQMTGLSVSGLIFTEELVGTDNVSVVLMANATAEAQQFTDVSGEFRFEGLDGDQAYTLEMNRNTRFDDGLTTLDLLLMQRHILGLGLLDTPYKIIAGDIDNNGRITTGDLVKMRRVILGVDNTFGDAQANWKFIPADHQFANPYRPFPIPKIAVESSADGLVNVEVISVKLGDVNGSNEVSSRLKAKVRSTEYHQLSVGNPIYSEGSMLYDLPIYADDSDLLALQYGIRLTDHVDDFVSVWSDQININTDDYNINNTELKMAWTNDDTQIDISRPLFYIRMAGTIDQNGLPFEMSEMFSAWIDKSLIEQELAFVRDDQRILETRKPGMSIVSISPNPIVKSSTVTVELVSAQHVSWTLISSSGQVISRNGQYFNAGSNQIQLSEADFGGYQGVLFLHVNSPEIELTERLIRIGK
jgi:hypothetical protein